MSKTNTKIGDIFSVGVDINSKKYFQYIANDITQLNSDVIRVFKQVFPAKVNLKLSELVEGEVEFYAHCVTKLGVKSGCWQIEGNDANVGSLENILFRDSGDYGNPRIKISQNWWIWKINEKQSQVGRLVGKYQNAEVGIVVNPQSIVHRMRTGKYDFLYPDFE